ncbi:hypothetical protein L4C34_02370 [Vibrio profundum]|uniref:hypothetical protein n=1 Tax=Vibrio profundum TaxID=2910247 RepID=UPI003D14F4E6
MKRRNIHGESVIRCENHLIHSTVIGATNNEYSLTWFEEVVEHLESDQNNTIKPWVLLHDCRQWLGSSEDSWETNNRQTEWMLNNGCVLLAVVLSRKLQDFTLDSKIETSNYLVFFDYDEAYQACLDKVEEFYC